MPLPVLSSNAELETVVEEEEEEEEEEECSSNFQMLQGCNCDEMKYVRIGVAAGFVTDQEHARWRREQGNLYSTKPTKQDKSSEACKGSIAMHQFAANGIRSSKTEKTWCGVYEMGIAEPQGDVGTGIALLRF